MSRVSTLQGAHIPVRGHAGLFAVLLVVVRGRESLTPSNVVAAEDAESARAGEERLHATKAARARRIVAGVFVIGTQR